MTERRADRVERICQEALDLPGALRDEHLRLACGTDADLRREVETLLAREATAAPWFEQPALLGMGGGTTDTNAPTVTAMPGEVAHGVHAFTPGELVSGRFRIIREIAEGGMGVVYEAIDEKLVERRALKCAKPGFATHLPPEARNALRVTHPNVCRVFEIHTADTPRGPVDYLTMEYVEGGTLAAALKSGPLPEPEALHIALQVCAAVAAAHAREVLHRDLKPNNVLLAKDANGRTRAVVTDFGLAQDHAAVSTLPAWSGGAGTPPYLAPERWAGERATITSDVFALGVVLHELITGRRPAVDDRHRQSAEAGLPVRWRTVIARCLEDDPTKRYASATAVADALIDRRGNIRRVAIWTAAILVPLGFLSWPVMFPAPIPARLAVLPLEAADRTPLTTELAQGAAADLSNLLIRRRPRPPQLVVIPVEQAGGLDASDPAAARAAVGASHVLRGTLAQRGDQLVVRASIVDTTTKISIRDWQAQYPVADPGAVANALSGMVAAAFKLPRQRDAEAVAPAAYPAYVEGMRALRQGSAAANQAIAAFQQAAAIDPRSVLPPAGLAEAFYLSWVVTRDERALENGRRALARAERLNPDSLAVRLAAGRLKLVPGAYEGAVQEFLRARELEPTSAEASYGLARAYQGLAGHEREAVAAFQEASRLQPGYFSPLIDLGNLYYRTGNFHEAEQQWTLAANLAPGQRQPHVNLGALYARTGRFDEAERELSAALRINPRDRPTLNNLGALNQIRGRDAMAVALFERALTAGAETPALLQNLGDSYRRLGRASDAIRVYRLGRERADAQLVSDPADAVARARSGYFSARLGDRDLATRDVMQALQSRSSDVAVLELAVLADEALGRRAAAIAVLESAPSELVAALDRHPDLHALRSDPRFVSTFNASVRQGAYAAKTP